MAQFAIWGYIPPPYGGMTIHVKRLLPFLEDTGISYQMYNFSNNGHYCNLVKNYTGYKVLFWFIKLFFGKTETIHYVLTGRSYIRFLSVLAGLFRGKKIIIRIGGASLYRGLTQGSIIDRFFTRFALRHAAVIIGVNKNICQLAIEAGANPKKVKHIPGFIPPIKDDMHIPTSVKNYFRDKDPKLLVAGKIPHLLDNDIYGLYGILQMSQSLIKSHPNAGIVLFFQNNSIKDHITIENFKKYIEELKLDDAIFLFNGESELWPVMTISDIFIRPTFSDGDANSIREALYLGVPVVASDCVDRPDKVITFPTGDWKLLYNTIQMVIEKKDNIRTKIKNSNIINNSPALLLVIRNLLYNH